MVNKSKLKKAINRVDFQVFIFTAILVICSCSCIFLFNYSKTYDSMIESLTKRTTAIYQYLDQTIDKDAFETIEVYEDKKTDVYLELKSRLEDIKSTSDVRYLYTAKMNHQGEFIYLVDGLDNSATDFRYPGDLIEPEIIPDIQRAWNGESVLPKKILSTDWGKIFLAYYPIHGDTPNEIIGLLGIEFDADSEFQTYNYLLWVTPIIILVACLLAAWIAFKLFKRISNPRNQDLYNTDQLTQLKNRNSFEFDLKNFSSSTLEQLGIIVLDIDHLKQLNDTEGHLKGDEYIRKTAEAIRLNLTKNMWAYRIGGDEFAVFIDQASDNVLNQWKETFMITFKERMKAGSIDGNVSIGMVIYDQNVDRSIVDTFHRADNLMYQNKYQHNRQ